MLRPEPSRLPLLRELVANLEERVNEARQCVWLGEVAGLQETLTALRQSPLAEQLTATGITDTPRRWAEVTPSPPQRRPGTRGTSSLPATCPSRLPSALRPVPGPRPRRAA